VAPAGWSEVGLTGEADDLVIGKGVGVNMDPFDEPAA